MAEKTNFGKQKSCVSCMYFDHLTNFVEKTQVTICRLHPPSVYVIPVMSPTGPTMTSPTVWPAVAASDWCGDHLEKVNLHS